MREKHTLSAAALQFSMACSVCVLTYIFVQDKPAGIPYYPLALIAYAPAVYGCNRLFLQRQRSVLSLIMLNSVFIGGFFLSACLLNIWKGWVGLMFAGLFSVCLGVTGCYLALYALSLHGALLGLDASVVVLLVFTGYASLQEISPVWTVPAIAGCAAAILGTIGRRISRPLTGREWLLVSLVFCGVFGAMWILVSFAAAPAGSGVVTLWNLLVAAAKAIGAILWRVLLFLLSWVPALEGEVRPLPQLPAGTTPGSEVAEGSALAGLVLMILCGISVLALLLWELKKLRGLRLGGKGPVKAIAAKRKQLSLRQGLLQLLHRWQTWIRIQLFLWRNRNTPRGLYCILVQRCRMGQWRKKAGETPREFLLRLRTTVAENAGLAAALDEMIPALDAALYGRASKESPLLGAKQIRREFGAAVQRYRLRRLWEQLLQRFRNGRQSSKDQLRRLRSRCTRRNAHKAG